MTFWKYLRWISSIVFVALVLALGFFGSKSIATGGTEQPLPPVPTITH